MLWNALLHRCVAKQEHGSRPTCLFATWTWATSTHSTLEDSRLWQTGSHSGGRAQLAIDTTLVSPLRRDGSARNRAANIDGAALDGAHLRKERTYPELCAEGGWGLAEVGRMERGDCSVHHHVWRMRGLSQSLPSSEVGWQLHGPAGGVQCFRTPLPEPSFCLC